MKTTQNTTAATPYKAPSLLEIKSRIAELLEDPSSEGKPGERRSQEILRCNLTDADKLAYGSDLAATTSDLSALENDKAQIVAEFGARIKAKTASIAVLANKIRMGYEPREVATVIIMDVPKVGWKTSYRLDIGEFVDSRPMDDTEKQHLLAFAEEEAAKKSGFFGKPEGAPEGESEAGV